MVTRILRFERFTSNCFGPAVRATMLPTSYQINSVHLQVEFRREPAKRRRFNLLRLLAKLPVEISMIVRIHATLEKLGVG
jgi:hypothetical protein